MAPAVSARRYTAQPLLPSPPPRNLPRWQRYAVARPADIIDRPAITIVIDDLGVMHAGTERVVAMPGPAHPLLVPVRQEPAGPGGGRRRCAAMR